VVTDSGLNLKLIIDVLKREALPSEDHRYVDWENIESEEDEWILRKDDFGCDVLWQKVKLYNISAREFLSFAREDLEEISVRARVNALSNAKRAIECRADALLNLFNLKIFSLSHQTKMPWNLPHKLMLLKKLGIPAPNILKRWVSSKRNLLEHEYNIADQVEIQDTVEIAELYLEATDAYIDKGYLASATVVSTSWFKPGVLAPIWFGKKSGESGSSRFEYENGMCHEYKLEFDSERKTVTLSYSESELYRRWDKKTAALREHKSKGITEEKPVIIPILDCAIEEVIELMILLREKAK